MYFNFSTVEIEGKTFVSMDQYQYSDTSQGDYSIPVTKPYFEIVDHRGKEEIKTNLWEGWRNYPLFTFNPEKYNAGEDPFEPFDPYTFDWFKASVRRKNINENIKSNFISIDTELKKLRKALMVIIENLPAETKGLKEIKDFQNLSTALDTIISQTPKSIIAGMDLQKINGKMEDPNDVRRDEKRKRRFAQGNQADGGEPKRE